MSETLEARGHEQPCYYCGEPCSSLAGDPGQWPVLLSHRDGTGRSHWHHHRCIIDRLEPAAPDHSPEGWPSGWKLVPVEPTEEMYAAAEREWDGRMSARSRGVWQAMLAAAPAAPASGAEAQLQRICEHYDMRSELYTSDAELAAGLANIARAALSSPSPSPPGWEAAREALEAAQTALNDWLVTYAEDCCSEEACEETRKRISELGTLGYITSVQEIISAALAGKG